MYGKILAAINEHVNSETAARYAKHLSKTIGAKLYLCSIEEQDEKAFEQAREAVKRVQHASLELGIETECIFEKGDAAGKIREIAASIGADLVFTAARLDDVRKGLYMGSGVARRILREVRCSVALVRIVHMGRIHPREVLVPLKERIDHIPERAYFTAMLARAFAARVHLFHIAAPVRNFRNGEKVRMLPEGDLRLSPDIRRYTAHLESYEIDHENRLVHGTAARTITIEAAARRRDLIIMGSSERNLFDNLIKHHPVEYVLRETPCNLIIMRPGK